MNQAGPLAHRDFRFLVSARVVDMLGNAIAPVALAFAVLDLTGSAAALGIVVAARSVANVALVLFGGVLADRWKRSTVLVWSNVLSAGSQATVAALVLTDAATVPRLLALSVVNGAAAATSLPAASALVPQTVPSAALGQANALTRLGSNGAAMAGAALGGLLVAAVGPGWGLAVDAASFLLAGLLYAGVRASLPPRTRATSTWEDLRDGWQAFTSRTWIWAVVAAFAVLNAVFAGGVHVLGPVVADQTVGRAGWGFVLASETAGMAAGAVVAMRWQPRRPLRAGMLCASTVGLLPIALAVSPTLPVLLATGLVAGVCIETFAIAWDTSLQTHVPPDRLARVYSYDMLGSFVAIPVGEVTVGPLAEAIGTDPVLIGAGVLALVVSLATLSSRSVRDLSRGTPGSSEPPPSPAPTLVGH